MILFFSDIPWTGMYQRPQHLAVRFAKHEKVLFIEPVVLSIKPVFRPVEVQKNIFRLSLPVIPYNARQRVIRSIVAVLGRVPLLQKIVTMLQLSLLQEALHFLKMSEAECTLFIQNFQVVNLVKKLRAKVIWYDYIDNAFGFVELPKALKQDCIEVLQIAAGVSVTSKTLQQQISPYRHKNIFLVSNGVESDHFCKRSAISPSDLPLDKPIIGFIGAVYPWLDFSLLNRVCVEMPDTRLVLIGRPHPDVAPLLEKLRHHPNFSFLDFRPYPSLPDYVNHFAAAIIPFQRNVLTEAMNPVKLYEYCAAGVPVVSTFFSPDLEDFKEFIFIQKSDEEFIACLQMLLTQKATGEFRQKIKEFAKQHDWNTKAELIYNELQKVKSLG